MSRKAKQPLVRLSLIAKPGISIRLLDGTLQEVARGQERLLTSQPVGLYLVEWSSGGQQSQSLAQVDGQEPEIVIHFDPGDPSLAQRVPEAAKRLALGRSAPDALLSGRGQDASVMLIVSAAPEVDLQSEKLQVRLLNREDKAVSPVLAEAAGIPLEPDELGQYFWVKPGRYHLDYRSISGERFAQAVPVLRDRRTIIFMSAAQNRLLLPDGERFLEKTNVGIDPTRTIIITVTGHETDYRVRERLRLAGLLLYDIAQGTSSLADDLVEILDDPSTDILLKLYGALVALSCIERGISPATGEPLASSLAPAARRLWSKRIQAWLGKPDRPGLPSDAVTAWWQLRARWPDAVSKPRQRSLPTRIEVPPMLECSWRWAIEESILRPQAVRETALIAAAARSAGGTTPWLCWKAAAVKARPTPPSRAGERLEVLADDVAQRVWALTNGEVPRATGQLARLSADTQAAALHAAHHSWPKGRHDEDAVRELALSLGLPSRQLEKRLLRTRDALDALGSPSFTPAAEPKYGRDDAGRTKAPGLSRRIVDPDDPQKGRFGGSARQNGFSLSARFMPTRSKSWVEIVLRVEGPIGDGEQVQFHLHDSFKPPCEKDHFSGGVAELVVSAWGGFTVGVWIPTAGVELELDLAQLPRAPHVIKTR